MLKSKKIVDWLYNYSLYFIIGALLLVIIAIEPSFVRVSNFTTILTQSATKIIYACGIAGIIVLGGTDLALGREVGLAAVVAASLLQAVDYSQRVFSADQVPALPLIVPLLLVMVLLGIICAAHGFIVAHWGVAPFVASLGVQLISYGLCLQYFNTVCNSNPLSGFTKTYSKFCQGTIRIGNISLSYLMFYAIAVVAVMWVIWNRTTLGKNMFAIGGNREAAKVCGVNVKRTIIIVYIIAGLLCHFMAGGVGQVYRADLTVLNVDIRHAQTAGTHFDKHLAGAGHRDRLFLNLQGFVITAQHRRAHGFFHCGTSFTHSKETAPAPESVGHHP